MRDRMFQRGIRPLPGTLMPGDETEAALWAEGTKYTKSDILKAYREHRANQPEPLDMQSFCQLVLGIENDAAYGRYKSGLEDHNG